VIFEALDGVQKDARGALGVGKLFEETGAKVDLLRWLAGWHTFSFYCLAELWKARLSKKQDHFDQSGDAAEISHQLFSWVNLKFLRAPTGNKSQST
jgi:hypothetical protein